MHTLDWIFVAGVFAVLATIALRTQKYLKDVAGFLAGGRCAGRYMLTLADGMAATGAIGFIGVFQQNYEAGFGGMWWGGVLGPVMMIVSVTGFVIYRFRETRAMTMAQFFEMRYSRNFRIFAGILAYVSGIINYGIFPAVTGRFLIYFCGIPNYIVPLGPLNLNLTLGVVMAVLLGTALLITFKGGQIAIMVTDFVQAQYVNVIFLLILVVLFFKFGWSDAIETLKTSAPKGKSLLNPFAQEDVPNFNVWYFAISAFNMVYSWMSWQGTQGYNCSARTPHEAKMAKVLAGWRFMVTWSVIALIPLCAYVVMHGTQFTEQAGEVNRIVDGIAEAGVDKQVLVPMALKQVLPIGVLGLFVGAMLAASISTDDTYLHSWGSIMVQDIIMPFRKKALTPEEHVKWLRRSILIVAVFVWCWSMFFPLQEYIFMYWAITGAIYVGGSGAAIIGGFYWKRATTAGAWAAMITGAILGVGGLLILNVFWPFTLPKLKEAYPAVQWLQELPKEFWLNGLELYFYTALCAVAMYIGVSLLTKPKPGFSMDKLLHRGEYAIEGEHEVRDRKQRSFWAKLTGVDEEYTAFDRFVAYAFVIWTLFWFGIFVIGTAIGFYVETNEDHWARYFLFHNSVWLSVGVVTVGWFLIMGFKDLRKMFALLKSKQVDETDDGSVA